VPEFSPAVENIQVELAEAWGVGDQVDLDDLPARYFEAEDDAWSSARRPYGSSGSVHERWSREPAGTIVARETL
jgi:hypothetical protein